MTASVPVFLEDTPAFFGRVYFNRLDCINTKTGEKFTAWQRVEGNSVTYVDKDDKPMKMPKVYEAEVVADELERPE